MAVRKSINIAGSGPTIEASVLEAIDRAYTTIEGITRFEVTKISGDLTDTGPVFDVEVTIWFTLLERMHE
jgi:flavin-binding protein dodecin